MLADGPPGVRIVAVAVLVFLLAVVIALLGVLVAGLLRSHAEILRALDSLGAGLDPDQPEPRAAGLQVPKRRDARMGADLVGTTPAGDAVSVGVVGVDRPTLIAFLTSGCSTCAGFWTAFSDLGRLRVPGRARIVVATKGEQEESPARLAKFAPPDVPVVMSSEAWDTYDVPVAPYFALVDGPSGAVIGEGAAATWENLRSMLDQSLEEAGYAPARRGRRRESPEQRVDAELLQAGIEPGDARLYAPESPPSNPEAGPARP